MASEGTTASHVCSGSTTWGFKPVKIDRRPQGNVTTERSEGLWSLLPWPRKRPMTLTIKYLGGSQCWFEVRARGRSLKRPGVVHLVELMDELMAGSL